MITLRLLFKHEMISLEPNSFNADSSSATVVLKMVCQSLLKMGHDGQLIPDLATSWTVSPDQSVYRFELDPQARFHSGRPCDAEAVAWNFNRLFDGRATSLLAGDYAGIESIEAIGKHTVEFRFQEPNTSFLHNLVWRTHVVDDCLTQPVGTGPFQLDDWQKGDHILLRRFDRYRTPPQSNVEKAVVRFAPSADERISIIERGEADIVENVPGGAAAGFEQRGLLHCGAAPSLQKSMLNFNCRVAPFNDPRVRLAVAHAIDRVKLAQTVAGPNARVVDGIIPRDDSRAVELEGIGFDPEKSRTLLREAGYADGLAINAAATNVAPVPKIVSLVTADLANVGISVNVTGYDDPPWWPYVYFQGPWQMAFQGAPGRPHLDTLFARELKTGGPFNAGGYSNPELDSIIHAARIAIDPRSQHELYGQAQRLVRADMPFLVLFASNVFAGWRPGVTGFRPHPLGVVDISTVNLQ